MPPNAYESGQQKMIPAVLVYLESRDHVLMIHRATRTGDIHSGKWNGLGGKMEKGESPIEAAQRELREESGIELPLTSFESRGVLHFPNFKAQKNEDWLVFLFWAHAPENVFHQALPSIPEGKAQWIEKSQLLSLGLWPGDKIFLPLLLAKEQNLVGALHYESGHVEKSWLALL